MIRDAVLKWACRVMERRPPDFVIGPAANPNLLRWYILRTPLGGIYLHEIRRPDDDRALHDHPWASCSWVLWGGYYEVMPNRTAWRGTGAVVTRRAALPHRLLVPRDGAVSLFLWGPRTREWGFHCPKQWVPWYEFVDPTDSGRVGRGCGDA